MKHVYLSALSVGCVLLSSLVFSEEAQTTPSSQSAQPNQLSQPTIEEQLQAETPPPPEPANQVSPEVKLEVSPDEDSDILKVFSASQQEEPLGETPVPVTIITSEMIRSIGATNLQEALIAFVPGMTLATDQNEMNVAMRGLYGSSQQSILIMLDGHRLNSHAYSEANPDYSMSLDKVQQIEVLRGPGSSLYGNVALSAVINIVTKTPKNADGLTMKAGLGNYGQRTASLLFGKEFDSGGGVLVWGNYFYSSGESRSIPASQNYSATPVDGYALLNAERDPASHDVGLKLDTAHFSILLNHRVGKTVEPFSSPIPSGDTYDYNAYRTFRGHGPGLTSESGHYELGFNYDFTSRVRLELTGYYDTNEVSSYGAFNGTLRNSIDNQVTSLTQQSPRVALPGGPGNAQYLDWQDDAFGAVAQVKVNYDIHKVGSGNVLTGFQVEQTRLIDSTVLTGANYGIQATADTADKRLLEPGRETSYSPFLQLKQRVSDVLIFNAGLRYDYRERHHSDLFPAVSSVSNLSPRLAIIYVPNDKFDLKLSYAQSFVDAPYWYRYNSLGSFRNSFGLLPEHLRSLQLTPAVSFWNGKIKNTLNFFYNDLTDIVFRDNSAIGSTLSPPPPVYVNAGGLRSIGVEEEFSLTQQSYRIHLNGTYQDRLGGAQYGARGSLINNIPPFVGNLIVDYNLFPGINNRFWISAAVRYYSTQLSPITANFVSQNGPNYTQPENYVPGYAVASLGARLLDIDVEGVKGFSLDLTINNLFNQSYYQGGTSSHPYPQPGTWFLFSVSYHPPII